MSVATIPVLIVPNVPDGAPVREFRARAVLSQGEIDGELVVAKAVEGISSADPDDAGAPWRCVLDLWPNSRGSGTSFYELLVLEGAQGSKVLYRARLHVNEAPEEAWPLPLSLVVNQAPFPPLDAGQQAVAQAQAFAQNAAADRAIAAAAAESASDDAEHIDVVKGQVNTAKAAVDVAKTAVDTAKGQVDAANAQAQSAAQSAAASAASIARTRRHDFVASKSYSGVAPAGSAENASVWTIRRITVAADGTTPPITIASAVKWTDRLAAAYA